ncbi:hypothetical protein [Streptomyces griseoflavus]|uniref:hypothetical protein n=1 Tax=Streptomyces griseoflavus TaxID=35619 RepID=UPI00198AB168|nr:hypothetical protein [Streptomyces griseoflavus]GGV48109.1 hypothetical protein GCM10010293_57600 [Streptomyces griseoflavus]
MSEAEMRAPEPSDPVTPEVEEAPEVPAASDEPAGKRTARRGRVAAAVGSVLLAGAVVAAAGYTVVTVKDADRDAGAPLWKIPKAAAEGKAPKAQGLAATLMPYGEDGWLRGPDLAEFGPDAQLDGADAAALLKKTLSDLPRTQRKRLEKEIDGWRVEGMAMRSYVSGSVSLYSEEDAFSVSIVLTRMEDRGAVRDLAKFQTGLLDAVDGFRKGPRVKGHKNARCFLPPKDEASDLDAMRCTAHAGNVLVTLTADGGKPLDTKSVAVLLGRQLDRIDEPGKAV